MSTPGKVHYMRSHHILSGYIWETTACGFERPNGDFLWTKQPEQVTCKKCQQSLAAEGKRELHV